MFDPLTIAGCALGNTGNLTSLYDRLSKWQQLGDDTVARIRLFYMECKRNLAVLDCVAVTGYNGPRNLDSVLSYTWEQKRGGPSG